MRYGVITLAAAIAVAAVLFNNSSMTGAAAFPSPEATPKMPAASERPLELTDAQFDGKEIIKSDDEWKKELTPMEYNILRQEGTEQAYTGALADNHQKGKYYCAACGLVLFKSNAKFESGTGWPSFFQTIYKKNVIEREDRSLPGEVRIKVECARCHSHIGHVFDDGPQPTGLRYCMNSAAMRFKGEK